MIRKESQRSISIKENVKGGIGEVEFKDIASSEELFNKIKMYSVLSLKKDCGLGYHCHEGEEEVILIKKGKAEYNDDGDICELSEGDIAICLDGHSHSICNKQDGILEFVALVLYK